MRPACSLAFFVVLLASRAVLAQCTSDNPLPFDRRIGQTQLHCEYLPEEDLRKWTITRPKCGSPNDGVL